MNKILRLCCLSLLCAWVVSAAPAYAFNYQAAGYPPPVDVVNKSGTIASGGVAQQLSAANLNRRGFWLMNMSAGSLWLSDVGTASAASPSLEIKPGVLYEFPYGGVPASALSIYGATTGQAFAAREW